MRSLSVSIRTHKALGRVAAPPDLGAAGPPFAYCQLRQEIRSMVKRRVYDEEKHVHFVTFSCYRRRSLLETDQTKRVVIGQLGSRLKVHQGLCLGFVIMPDHIHTLIWFPEPRQLSPFMNHWKDLTAHALKDWFRTRNDSAWSASQDEEPVWQPRYYGVNLWSRKKVEEKLSYMHLNPVKTGLVEKAVDWKWSSARWYERRRPVGIPICWPPGLETDDAFTVS